MDGKRIFVQYILLLGRYQGAGWAADAIRSACDGHTTGNAYSEMPDDRIHSLINQAFVAGDVHRWAALHECACDRMTTEELHIGNVAREVMMTLFGNKESGPPNFCSQDHEHMAEIAGSVFDLVASVADKAERGRKPTSVLTA